MQWYHYVNAAVLGAAVYLYFRNKDTLTEEERAEYDAAMAQHEQAEQQQSDNEIEENEVEIEEPIQPRDPAAALAERQAQNAEHAPVASWKNREVGAKKAKSLARKEQRKMYFEYLENEARARKERGDIEEQMFGDLIAEERAQRELRSEQARIKIAEQQREKREAEEAERRNAQERKLAIEGKLASQGYAKLRADDDLTALANLGTIVNNGSFIVGGEKIIAVMEQALKNGQANWDELVTI